MSKFTNYKFTVLFLLLICCFDTPAQSPMADLVQSVLDSTHTVYLKRAEVDWIIFSTLNNTPQGTFELELRIREKYQIFMVVSRMCNIVPPVQGKMDQVGKFILDANNYIFVGSLGLDFNNKTYLCSFSSLQGTQFTREVIMNMTMVNVAIAQLFFPIINKMIYTDFSAGEALDELKETLQKELNLPPPDYPAPPKNHLDDKPSQTSPKKTSTQNI